MFDLNGNIEKGIGLGRDLGYPTLNIALNKPTKEQGVFVVEVEFLGERPFSEKLGVMHLGPKSFGTDDHNKIFCEIHVFGFNENIDSGEVYIKVLKKIRDVREFESTNELVAQISQDIDIAKQYFKNA